MTVADLVEKFGGVRPMARALGSVKMATSVWHWKSVNRIPTWRVDKVLEVAKAHGIDVTAKDLARD